MALLVGPVRTDLGPAQRRPPRTSRRIPNPTWKRRVLPPRRRLRAPGGSFRCPATRLTALLWGYARPGDRTISDRAGTRPLLEVRISLRQRRPHRRTSLWCRFDIDLGTRFPD